LDITSALQRHQAKNEDPAKMQLFSAKPKLGMMLAGSPLMDDRAVLILREQIFREKNPPLPHYLAKLVKLDSISSIRDRSDM
jgi:hypothetical protein